MRFVVATPTGLVVEAEAVSHVRAEDETGAFGIRPRHARFLTTLPVSVVSWRDAGTAEHHVAVRGGVLVVEDGDVEIATRQAVRDDDLAALARKVEDIFLREIEGEEAARTTSRRLHFATMRQIRRQCSVEPDSISIMVRLKTVSPIGLSSRLLAGTQIASSCSAMRFAFRSSVLP